MSPPTTQAFRTSILAGGPSRCPVQLGISLFPTLHLQARVDLKERDSKTYQCPGCPPLPPCVKVHLLQEEIKRRISKLRRQAAVSDVTGVSLSHFPHPQQSRSPCHITILRGGTRLGPQGPQLKVLLVHTCEKILTGSARPQLTRMKVKQIRKYGEEERRSLGLLSLPTPMSLWLVSLFQPQLVTDCQQLFRFINITFTGAALGMAIRIRKLEMEGNAMGAVGSSP